LYNRKEIDTTGTKYEQFFKRSNIDHTKVRLPELLWCSVEIANSLSLVDGVEFLKDTINIASYMMKNKIVRKEENKRINIIKEPKKKKSNLSIVKIRKLFNSSDMPDAIRTKLYNAQKREKGKILTNGTYICYTTSIGYEDWGIDLDVTEWLLKNGAEKDEEVLIYWWE
jgi:hypothetical protein